MLSIGGECYSSFKSEQSRESCPNILFLADIALGIALIIIGSFGLNHMIDLNSIGCGVMIGIGSIEIFLAPTIRCGCAIGKTIVKAGTYAIDLLSDFK